MSTIHITQESHNNPDKYRADVKDTAVILGPEKDFPQDAQKPVISSSSKVAIIGAGFGGLAASLLCKNKWKTDDFVVIEKHANWGGTWWANTYPGCASDIPALWYSIFSELNDNWSALRPPQYEMEEYILEVVKKHNLEKNAKMSTAAEKLVWNENEGVWKIYAVDIKSGQRYLHKCPIVLNCSGGLVYPNDLKAPGLEKFQGKYMHSALWDHSYDMKGKNVLVVGNGCSAAQVVPALVDDCGVDNIVQVFQLKHWILPPIPNFLYTFYRFLSRWRWGIVFIRWFIASFAEARYPLYQGNSLLARLVRKLNEWQCKLYIRKNAPQYYDKLVPDFKLGCKRIIFDYKYVPTLNNPKIHLNDAGIDYITEDTVYFKDGTSTKPDAIVACTGYALNRSVVNNVPVYGQNGVELRDLWRKEGANGYKTFMVRDMPNLFLFAGPNSATGHSSVVLAIENAAAFTERVAKPVIEGKQKSVVVKKSAYYDWLERTQARLAKAVFGTAFGGCTSWYAANDYNFTAYPFSQIHYFITSRWVGLKDFVYKPAEDKKTV